MPFVGKRLALFCVDESIESYQQKGGGEIRGRKCPIDSFSSFLAFLLLVSLLLLRTALGRNIPLHILT